MSVISRYIFRSDLMREYINNFNQYMITIIYGGNVIMGSDIENEWEDNIENGEV